MAGAKRKCVCCDEWIGAGEESVPYKGRYAHVRCFNTAIKAIKTDKDEQLEKKKKTKRTTVKKPKAELKDAMSEEDYKEKQMYYQYLKSLIGDVLSAKIYALTDDYIKRYDFTFHGMYQTLVYLHEIINKELTGDIIGIIPYYYTEAQQYYLSILDIADKNKDINITHMYHEKTIIIKPASRKIQQIDISSIGKD